MTPAAQSPPRARQLVGQARQFEPQVFIVLLQRVDTRLLQLDRLAHRRGSSARSRASASRRGSRCGRYGRTSQARPRQQQQQQQREQQPLPPGRARRRRRHGATAGAEAMTASGIARAPHGAAAAGGGLARKTPGSAASAREAPEGHDRLAVDDVAASPRRARSAHGAAGGRSCARRWSAAAPPSSRRGPRCRHAGAAPCRGRCARSASPRSAEPAHLAVERRVPVDASAGRIDLGNRQQVGMLARQALRRWPRAAAPAARHTGSPAMPSAR